MSHTIPKQRADRTQLQQIIAGLNDGVIIINLDQTIAWANEAALAMHGIRSLDGLGRTVDDYRARFELRSRSRHKLPDGHSPLDRLVKGEGFSETTVSVGPPGAPPRWTHQIRCLVVTDADGRADCLVLVINDVTEQTNAEQRFESTFAANPAPAIICRRSDLRFIKVNQGFLEMTGYRSEAVIGRTVRDFDVLEDAERREQAIHQLQRGETIHQREGRLRLPDGRRKFVIVAGHPIEVGDTDCMLFSFVDIDDRKQAEQQFRFAFALAPGPMAVIDFDGFRIMRVNEAFVSATGWQLDEVVGRRIEELKLWENRDARVTVERRLERDGRLRSVEVLLRRKDGELTDQLLSAETVTLAGRRCVLSVMQDISERKRTESELMQAIQAVMQDTSWFSQKIIEKLTNLSRPGGPGTSSAALSDLSHRECEVLSLMARGLSDAEITAKLAVSRNTVRNHVAHIYRKTGVHGRGAAVVWARERGLGSETASPEPRRSKRGRGT